MSTLKTTARVMLFGLAFPLSSIAQSATANAEAVHQYKQAEQLGQQRLKQFDNLDFDVYTNQKWDRLKETHADNILVHYPDGHTTRGIPDHITEIKQQFTFAPDTKIRTHPVRIVSSNGEWTSVIGVLEGRFTKPMAGAGGTMI